MLRGNELLNLSVAGADLTRGKYDNAMADDALQPLLVTLINFSPGVDT